jgi:hypothetical protein
LEIFWIVPATFVRCDEQFQLWCNSPHWTIIIGTQDLLGLFGKKHIYNADVHVAVKIPILARKQKDRDRDFVSNKEDKCKKEKGSWVAKGCPDRDGDGVLDTEDKCPDIPGPRETQGCPDRDAMAC